MKIEGDSNAVGIAFFIFMSVIAICVACGYIFSGEQDSLSSQIDAIDRAFCKSDIKEKIVTELISKYNPTNQNSEIKNTTK